MTGRAKELSETIVSAEKELKEIQDKCSHKTHSEVVRSWGPGRFDVGNVCDDCGKFLDRTGMFQFSDLVTTPIINKK